MSQGSFHKGNIFSFVSDEFERPQQDHIAQQSRRDKLRVQQHSFEAAAHAAAVEAGHDPLVTIQEEEEDLNKESGTGRIYGGPAGTSNMLSEMFNNFPAPTSELHLTAGQGSAPATGLSCYHRLIQQKRPADRFYGCNIITPSATSSWSEDSAAAVVKHHGIIMNDPDSSRRFFDNVVSSAPASFGAECCLNLVGVGGGAVERQLLSLSSSELHQLEMTRAENQMRVISRSEQGDHRFFLSTSTSNEEAADELMHPSLPPPQPYFHQQAACHEQAGGQLLQAHMSYGPVSTLNIFRNSLYARAAKELLEEFCSVGHLRGNNKGGRTPHRAGHILAVGATTSAATASCSSSKEIPPLSSADRFENQRKKSKLLSMLDEVERRYNHYCEQMQMVVNSFDSIMGFGAATPYTALAHKAMSRHFRCLKDAITGQLKQTCELLGDKEGAINGGSGGLTKVETPKLRLIDQSLRQQRAFHQLGMMDHQDQAWRPQRGLPDRSVTILRAWLFDHFLHPYPSDADKHLLARQTGLSRSQVSNWFINARVRLWKPMVEDMYQKEAKEAEDSQPLVVLQTPDFDSPECVPMPRQNFSAPINSQCHQQQQLGDDDATASPLIFSPGPPHNDMYRLPAAMLGPSAAASQARAATTAAAAKTGDLSLTLGLRHAGVNPPETGRFGV